MIPQRSLQETKMKRSTATLEATGQKLKTGREVQFRPAWQSGCICGGDTLADSGGFGLPYQTNRISTRQKLHRVTSVTKGYQFCNGQETEHGLWHCWHTKLLNIGLTAGSSGMLQRFTRALQQAERFQYRLSRYALPLPRGWSPLPPFVALSFESCERLIDAITSFQ